MKKLVLKLLFPLLWSYDLLVFFCKREKIGALEAIEKINQFGKRPKEE